MRFGLPALAKFGNEADLRKAVEQIKPTVATLTARSRLAQQLGIIQTAWLITFEVLHNFLRCETHTKTNVQQPSKSLFASRVEKHLCAKFWRLFHWLKSEPHLF